MAEILETSYDRPRKLEEWGVSYPKTATGDTYTRIPSRGLKHVMMMVIPRLRDRVGDSAVIDALRRRAIRARIAQHPRVFEV